MFYGQIVHLNCFNLIHIHVTDKCILCIGLSGILKWQDSSCIKTYSRRVEPNRILEKRDSYYRKMYSLRAVPSGILKSRNSSYRKMSSLCVQPKILRQRDYKYISGCWDFHFFVWICPQNFIHVVNLLTTFTTMPASCIKLRLDK